MRFYKALAALMALVSTCLCSTASTRPHIIVIVADDLGYNDVSFHGSDQIPTPNIDFLAYNGILLNNYYVSPICTPTRSALLTGRHPVHLGTQHSVIFGDEPWGLSLNETLLSEHVNKLGYRSHIVGKWIILESSNRMQHSVIIGDQPYGLPLNETLMSQHLNNLGYRSHIVGKWHLGMVSWDYTPLYRGFESHLGYYQGCEDYYDHTYDAAHLQWGLDFRRDKDLLWNHTGLYSTDIFRDEAVKVIKNHNKSEPLFLYLPFQAVHSGNGDGPHLQAPLEYINKFLYIENKQRRIYAAMVSALDDAVGTVYDTLKARDMLSNSIIVFTTDNGGPANGFDYNAANNFPLRGVKATLWEGGVRGVGLVHSPLLKQQGYVANQMLHVCDWLPTLYSAAGGNVSELKNLDGYDAWSMLNENGPAVRNEMLHNIDPLEHSAAIRVGDYKLLLGDVSIGWGGWYPPYKLHGDEELLHYLNFTKDGGSFVNEREERRNVRRDLDAKYRQYWPSDVIKRLQTLYDDYGINNKDDGKRHSQQQKFFDLHFDSELSVVNEKNIQREQNDIKNLVRETPQQRFHHGTPVKIECGDKPWNASTNCQPYASFCLYNISEDPCEYNNIAEQNPQIVEQLLKRLMVWNSSMVKPRNVPGDDAGNPKHHGGAWVPWR